MTWPLDVQWAGNCIAIWGRLGEVYSKLVCWEAVSRYKFCIVTEGLEWLSVVSQYTIVYCDRQGLAWFRH